jgi:hypothetical protein
MPAPGSLDFRSSSRGVPATPFAPSFFATAMLDHGTAQLGAQLQAVWYRAAIMALCWPATPSEVKFAADLYGAFSVKRLFWVCCQFFVRSGKAVLRSLIAPQVAREFFSLEAVSFSVACRSACKKDPSLALGQALSR